MWSSSTVWHTFRFSPGSWMSSNGSASGTALAQNWHRICTFSSDIEICHSFRRSSRWFTVMFRTFWYPVRKGKESRKSYTVFSWRARMNNKTHMYCKTAVTGTALEIQREREVFAGSLEQSRDKTMKRWGRPRAMQELSVRNETQPSSLIAVRMTLRSRGRWPGRRTVAETHCCKLQSRSTRSICREKSITQWHMCLKHMDLRVCTTLWCWRCGRNL